MPHFTKTQLKEKAEELGLYLDKKRGQCVLTENEIAHFAVESLAPEKSESVLEIGPGFGILTEILVKRARHVHAIEFDKKMIEFLKDTYNDQNLTLIHGDCIKTDWPPVSKIISNLPYHISGPFFSRLCFSNCTTGVFMVQKEFAERLMADVNTKEYNRVSILTQICFQIQIIKAVPRQAFYPQPEVDSVLIKIESQASKPEPASLHELEALLQGVFPYKGKVLQNGLKYYAKREAQFQPVYQELIANPQNVPLRQRIRHITPQEFLQLAKDIQNVKKQIQEN